VGVLTRAEAQRRAQIVCDVAYTVDLDLTGEPGRGFTSRTTVRFTATPGQTTFVDLDAVAVDSAMLNGRPLPPAWSGRISLPGLLPTNELVVQARCAYSRASVGMHRFVDPEDGEAYLYTQFQPFDAHRVFACFDQPDIKATTAVSVRAPGDWVVVGNSTGRRDGDRWQFDSTPPIPTYVMAVVAGPYHHVHDRHGDVDLGLYCRRSLAQHLEPEEVFNLTRRGLDFYTELFGRDYPFTKYDQIFVPEFALGAMENVGCVTIDEHNVFRSAATEADRLARANVILHELAHMWFGNLVTMRWWDDLWLNEAFATYLASLTLAEATRFSERAWVEFAYLYKSWAYEQDQRPTTHPIIADIPHTAGLLTHFDGITYGKGAAVLKQLAHWVGRTAFRDGVCAYIAERAFGTGELTDFLRHLEQASGRDLSTWSRQWLATAGLGVLRAECDIDDDGRLTACTVVQQAPTDHPTLRQHRVAIGLYTAAGDALVRTAQVELDVQGPRTTVPGLAGERVDLVLLNDDDLSYVKVSFDGRSLATLRAGLGRITAPLARALCWSGLWEMTRDGKLAARDWVALVATHAERERDPTVLQALLRQAVLAIDHYSAPGSDAASRRMLAATARQALGRAEPGSDAQLIWARRTIAIDPDPTFARDLLAGRTSVPDLALDTDLRWQIVVRLAVLGTIDAEEIATESARDPSDLGHRRAWTARASLPDPARKAAAFAAARDGQDGEGVTLSLATQRAILAGFWRAEQPDLLAPYAAHGWIDALAQVWAERNANEALALTSALFPTTRPDPTLIAAANRLLDTPWLPSAGRRIVVEGRDDAQRALRAQRADASRETIGDEPEIQVQGIGR
jgi:aminopeptidase N